MIFFEVAQLRHIKNYRLIKLFQEANAETGSAIFSEYLPSFSKFISDTHAGAQERALEAFQILITKYPLTASKDFTEATSAILEKAFSAAKVTIRTKASDCLLILAESKELYKGILEIITNNLDNASTQSKVHIGCLQALTQLLNNFGHTIFPVTTAIKSVAKLANSTNSLIRQEVMNYFVEAYRWDKDEVSNNLSSLRTAQQEELKGRFSEVKPAEKPLRTVKGVNASELSEKIKKKKEEEKGNRREEKRRSDGFGR